MPSKTEEYLALAQRTANGLTRYWESWTDYLTTASRLYKYPFPDQLMIYAQRPDATACAEFDIWRNRMNRYVRRGSKGIALLDESSGFPRLHYVFDVSDTGVRRNSRDPEVWQFNDDLKQPVSEMLAATYGISGERVSQQLADVAGKLVADYWDNNGGDIRAIVDGSLLMDYDEAGVEMQFKSAAAISVTYTLLERCGIEPAGWFDKDDFQAIYNFSTPDSVYALGAAVSDMSREVLRNIERTVKTTIRRRNNERSQHEYEQQSELHADRGLSSPEPDPPSAEDPAGQVRQAAPDVSDESSPGAVQHDAPVGEPVPAPDGGGADGREPDAADDDRTAGEEPGPGQGAESDGMGAAHEQPESTGRGTGADGADLQLSFLDANIPTEAQQIEKIDRAESEKTPSAFSLSQSEIENELRRHGSGFAGGKQRIMALYQTQPDRKLRAKALAKEYGIGGHSHDFLDGSRGFVNHDWKGLEFDHYPDHQKITLKWAQVEKYIDLMIQSDRYLTDEEKEQRTTVQEENGYKVGDDVMVDLPTGTIEGTIGYIGETDVRIDTSAHGQSWDNEVINKRQFEDGLRQNEPSQRVDEMLEQAETIYKESEVPEYERFSVREVVGGTSQLFAIWDDLNEGYYANDNGMAQFTDKEQAESYCTALKKETDERTAADWLAVEKAKFLAENEPVPALPKERNYRVGDTIRLDGKDFTVETVGTLNIQLRDPDEVYPVARSESKENLERLLRQPGNIHLHNLTVNLTPAPEPAGNFHITDDHLGEGGAKQKYARNIEAIRTLFKLEDEHRGATAEEQQVLSQYVGWGGLADAFAPDKDNWAKEYTVKEVRPRYSCFYKIRHPGDCDGQSGYGVSKLDSIVEEVVRQIFAQFREVSRKKLLESVKTNDAARIQKKVKKIQKDLESKQKELDDLKAETILVIRGVSALDKELLGTLVAEARETLETLEKQLVQAQEEYEEATKTAKRSNYICNELFTWADVYDTANHDERRAILQQFITEIRVRKDYEISITLNASFNQVEQLKAVSTYDGAEIFEEISEKGA